MIRIVASDDLLEMHVSAVVNRMRKDRNEDAVREKVCNLGVSSIEGFLTATPATMRNWVEKCPGKLQFTEFRTIYTKYFSNGDGMFVDGDYNAYRFLEKLDITVCPYCDDESLHLIQIDGKRRRTAEIDHFFPKSSYPALAMCFYNLIPCGHDCNTLKMEHRIGVNPYEDDIESKTFLYPDIEIGVSMENVSPKECAVRFNPSPEMIPNVEKLALEQRYERYSPEVHELLKRKQNYPDEKIQEMVRMHIGTREEIIELLFGSQDPSRKKDMLRQKMLRDLTGY